MLGAGFQSFNLMFPETGERSLCVLVTLILAVDIAINEGVKLNDSQQGKARIASCPTQVKASVRL